MNDKKVQELKRLRELYEVFPIDGFKDYLQAKLKQVEKLLLEGGYG